MTLISLKAWLQQPTTILGLATAAGTIAGLAAHVLTHDTTTTAAVAGTAFALVHVALPDNSAAPSTVEQLLTDAMTAVAQKHIAAALPQLMADTMAVIKAFQTATPVAPVAPVAAPVAPVAAPVAPVPVSVVSSVPVSTP